MAVYLLRLTVSRKRLPRFLLPTEQRSDGGAVVEDVLQQIEKSGSASDNLSCFGVKLKVKPLRRRRRGEKLFGLTVVGYNPDGSDVIRWRRSRGIKKKIEVWEDGRLLERV